MARIDTHVEHLIADVADLRASFARLDAKMDAGFSRRDAKIDRHLLVLGTLIATSVTTLAGLVAKGFHWL